ncbi:hypothetical protein [Hwangdonia lutea]|uniref:Right handed beta helix domain-containing protein n=1 Tax=Hwangdonia lutea TaxID=3075823 RepID=A0AA97EM48_9FLAO|nr:hypothetical protein [Hwangdonia sp. SCSIO 19198]WOD43702.1 hypothetical protein RNZ46_00200 [Hwangdonia sp. SCSIO 19198]
MKTKQLFTLFTALVTFTCFSQNTITVDNNPGITEVTNFVYANLQDAIDAAQNNDTLYIQASATSYGDVTVNKTLNIIGRSHSENNKISYIDNMDVTPNASNSYFSGLNFTDEISINNPLPVTDLVFENNYINHIGFSLSSGGINNCIIRGNVVRYLGESSSWDSPIQNGVLTNNIFLHDVNIAYPESVSLKNNIFFCYTGKILIVNESNNNTDLIIENSIILKMNSNAGSVSPYDGIQFKNCLTYNPNASVFDDLPGTGNLNNTNPQFENVTDDDFDASTDDYHLKAGSPAIGAGTDGEDIGLYNASGYLFNMFGITYGTPTVNITNITESVQEGQPLQVTITASSN